VLRDTCCRRSVPDDCGEAGPALPRLCGGDAACPVPGYVDYGINHGATLMVDVEEGHFAFFYMPVDL